MFFRGIEQNDTPVTGIAVANGSCPECAWRKSLADPLEAMD